LAKVVLNAAIRVDRVFSLFADWSTSLLRFATENEVHALTYERMVQQSKDVQPETGAFG
jgi:hypothetical protein